MNNDKSLWISLIFCITAASISCMIISTANSNCIIKCILNEFTKKICSFDCNLWSTKLLNQKWYTIFYGFEIDKIKTEFMRQQKKTRVQFINKKKVECNRMMCGGGYTKEWAIELETHFADRKNKKKKSYMWRIWICGFSTTENAYEQKKTIDFFCEMVLSAEGEGRRPRKIDTEKKRRS